MHAFSGSMYSFPLPFLPKNYIHITIPDILVLLFFGITLATYNWQLNPEPDKLLFGGQLLVLWLVLRLLLKRFPSLRLFFLLIIVCTGLIEALWGLEQLYGYRMSNHSLFRLTGSFYNPGPYSGYLAAVFPLSLYFILRVSRLKKHSWWHYTSVIYGVSVICFVLVLLVLPAGMSRSAWLAALISSGWVYWNERLGWKKAKEVWGRYKKWVTALSVISIVCLSIGLYGIYLLKKDSADGRLLMSKITTKAILHQPVTGTGLGGFPAAYANEQARYFTSETATQTEQLVAGAPEYAFNEYLQIGLEQGVFGLIVFLLLVGCCFYSGIKNRRIGTTGGLLSLTVFASTSYPLQLPAFWVLLVFLLVTCIAEPSSFSLGKSLSLWVSTASVGIVAALLCFALFYLQQGRYTAYAAWSKAQILYKNSAYAAAVPQYATLYEFLNHKPEYLFEYAQCLHKTGDYQEAVALLERASLLSADPMIHYMIAKNKQELKMYREAEYHLLHGIDILPERIYPYYLLSKLYAAPDYYDPDKLQAAIDSVLTKEPKVETTAIREMRNEVKKAYNKTESE